MAREARWFTAQDVAAAAGVSRQAAHRSLARLVGTGALISEGKGRATRYHAAGSAASPVPGPVRFDRSYLSLPVIQNERTVKEFVRNAPANIVLKYKNTNSFTAQVRRRLRAAGSDEWPEFDFIACKIL